MAANTRSHDLQKEVEQLKTNSENMERKFDAYMEEMRKTLADIANDRSSVRQSQNMENEVNRETSPFSNAAGPQFSHGVNRHMRIDCPRFNGDGVKEWLYRAEQYFELEGINDNARVKIAGVHMEGRALCWHQSYLKIRRGLIHWEEYVLALQQRFGTTLFEDPMSDLKKLKQTGAVQTYLDSFDELFNKVDIPEEYAVSLFLTGLKEEIEYPIRMFAPRTLQRAYGLARMQEQSNFATLKKPQPTFNRNTPILSTPANKSISPPYKPPNRSSKILSSAEMDEKRAKGLCFWCDEKYSYGHQCGKRKQIFVMEMEDEFEDEDNNEVVSQEEGDNTSIPLVSLHAMSGIQNFNTMRVTGSCNNKPIHILVDSGSTHNFLDIEVAKKLECRLTSTPAFVVAVADGNMVHSNFMCNGFSWKMHGVTFVTDVLVMALGGCDLVLGVQWLVTLGDITWNFSKLAMEFYVNNKKVSLRGSLPSVKVVKESTMKKILAKPAELAMMGLSWEAIKCMRHSRRTTLTTDDVDSALGLRNVEPLYGFASGDPLRFRRAAGHKDLFYIEEKDVEFKEVIEAPLPKAPLDTSLFAHWLAIEGVQPAIPENPPPEALQALSMPSDNRKSEYKEDGLPIDIKLPVKHVLSRELQLYFEKITELTVSRSESPLFKEALVSLSTDSGLHPLVPYFTFFVADEVIMSDL
ncbi:hypothetical protein RD792_002532 [Penstemon davidsonii]|uniref:TATA box binding protein associated factor (TAF) histone-like fold domain-containing protein n=1 Tax=Penstemon davidsonii TaxID=160366 RepID=A0ABR0DRA3_9LAMI|nr:hypothetical protein RD792_002532 [Penstemon davidsonii]